MILAFDTETYLIAPGILAPPLVCGSVATDEGRLAITSADQTRGEIRDWLKADLVVGANIAYDMGVLAADDPTLLPAIFRAYEDGRVYDVQIAQALDAIAGGHLFIDPRTRGSIRDPATGKPGRYSLSVCADLMLGRVDAKKNDLWRLRYALLRDTPMDQWPEEALEYPKDDARNTLEIALAQLGRLGRPGVHEWVETAGTDDGFLGPNRKCLRCDQVDTNQALPDQPCKPYLEALQNLHNLPYQTRAAWALHLGAIWGIRTDPEWVRRLEARTEKDHAAMIARFTKFGLIRSDGSEDQAAVKKAVAKAYGATGQCPVCSGSGKVKSAKSGNNINCKARVGGCDGTGFDLKTAITLPLTETGGVSISGDTLRESGDDDLDDYAETGESEKYRETYIPFLKKGYQYPINLSPNVLVETGRTSYTGLIQTIPRGGGIREAFVSRTSYYFCSIDYSAIELCTLAQCCLWIVGYSKMADLINETGDPGSLHTALAAKMIGVSFEDLQARVKAKDKEAMAFRQAGKLCLGGSTKVLTHRGWVPMLAVTPADLIWDGVEWVTHQGLVCRGEKDTWRFQEVDATADHEILTGSGWQEWQEVRTKPSLFQSALNSARLPLSTGDSGLETRDRPGILYAVATAAGRALSIVTTSFAGSEEAVRAVGLAELRAGSNTGPRSQTSNIARGYSHASMRHTSDVVIREMQTTRTMGGEGSPSSCLGSKTDHCFSGIYKRVRAGMIQTSKWIGSITTKATDLGTCALSHHSKTSTINVQSNRCSNAFESLKQRMLVYDIAFAGPRNRFTIWSSAGPLIVHNCNFGLGGGMGEAKLVLTNRKRNAGTTTGSDGTVYAGIRFCILVAGQARCGVEKVTEWRSRSIPPTCKICLECAVDLRRMWFDQWPEMREYFAYVTDQVDAKGQVTQFISERIRGGVDFTQAANTCFQGLAADGSKHALWKVSKECYTDPSSPMFGSRPVFFNHDEIFSEIPVATADASARRMTKVMIDAMREYVPDVKVAAEPALMTRWSKDAAMVVDGDGKLVPWEKHLDHEGKKACGFPYGTAMTKKIDLVTCSTCRRVASRT